MSQTPLPATPSAPLPTDFSQIPVDALESIRNRLNQIHLSLRKLSDQINNHNRHPSKIKLPSFTHFQNQFQILIFQLTSVANILYSNEDLLRNTNVYPTVSFPTSQQEGLLTTLLRKKPLPEVDEWITSSILAIDELQKLGSVNLQKDEEFKAWCSLKLQELREDIQFYGFGLEEDISDNKEAQLKKEAEASKVAHDAKITGGKKGLHPNVVAKFMCQGQI